MNSKYDYDDLEKLSVRELCNKYGSSVQAIKKALYRNGIRKFKTIKITSPFKEPIYVADKQKCADELNISRQSVINALNGKNVKILDELGIKIEYAEEK